MAGNHLLIEYLIGTTMRVTDETAYMRAVIQQFRDEAAEAPNEFELKKRLWHASVVTCEVSPEHYRDWHLTLSEVALEHGLKATAIVTTIRSARRKAGVV